jgi:biotin synthase-related radical SAM superfamily protein
MMTIEKIRLSIGSAVKLGLHNGSKFLDPPTTCYLMTYIPGRCIANCGFCPQARGSNSSIDLLSRVNWPIFNFKDFLTKLSYIKPKDRFKRICIQTLNYATNFEDVSGIITEVKKITDIPISVAIPPFSEEKLLELKIIGVEKVGIALDASNEELFEEVKGKRVNGPYNWHKHHNALRNALNIFSEGNVTTHLIVGLGETERDLVKLMEHLKTLNINASLFAFTPIKGTKLEYQARPDLLGYRRVQLSRYMIYQQGKPIKSMVFSESGKIIKFNINKNQLWYIISETNAFLTSGCPDCNRPYYTSRPTGPIYNYPRELTEAEKSEIFEQLISYVS